MAIVISGNGIDMGGNPVSNVDVGSFDSNAATVDYVKNNGDVSAVTSFSQISGTNEIIDDELTNNIHDVFNDGSCIATYQLNGNANDLGGTYNGTDTNVTYEEGKFGQAANITNGYITTTIADNNTRPNITFSFFFKGTGSPIPARVNNSVNGLMFFVNNNNGFLSASALFAGFGWATNNILTNIPFTGDFHHCVYQITPTNIKIYIDKVEILNLNGNRAYNGGAFNIGKRNDFSTPQFQGTIDQVRVFNRALTESEINTLYTESRVSVDAQLNINQGTFIYPKGLGAKGYIKSSDVFTGTVNVSAQTDGWKYVAKDENNNFSFYTDKPTIGKKSATLYLKDGRLHKTVDDTPITPISFLSNKVRIVSGVAVELAPSGIAKSVIDSIEAKEVFGKNQCTGFIHSNATFTPPSILDYYNISTIVRNGLGNYTVTFIENMQNANYSVIGNYNDGLIQGSIIIVNQTTSSFTFETRRANDGGQINPKGLRILIFGGKN